MDETSNKNNAAENSIIETMNHIEELMAEFGALHPLVDKTIRELLDRIQQFTSEGRLSDDSSAQLACHLGRRAEIWVERKNKAREEQKRLDEERSSASTACAILGGVAALGVAAFAYWCFRRNDPVQVIHSHSGSINETISINASI